jgi:O-antigen/teichoic acid export membrane protein
MTIVLILFARAILGFLGKDFVDGYWLMIILLLGHLIRSYFASGITLLQMADEERSATRILFTSALLVLLGYAVAIPILQTWGTAIVTSFGLAGVASWAALACKRRPGCYVGAF